MNKFINLFGIVLIVVGIVFITYTGYTYTTQEQVAEIGSVKITAAEQKTIPFSPIAGGICLAVGIGLIIFNRRR